jgi:hypothetical protein
LNNIIKAVIDVSVKGSEGLKSLRQQFAEAEGASGKLKTGFAATGDFIKSHAAAVALSAGTALVGFAVKAVGEFQALALESGKMGDALGIGSESASRLIEVFGDVGVESGKVEAAIGRMNRVAGTTPEVFDALGVQIATAADGTMDANETFIRAAERLGEIQDPAQRAAAGAKLFGKSWGEMAEVIESGNIRDALESVSGAKIIDEEEVRNARAFRDALDELRGSAEDFTLTIGGALVPALAEATEEANSFIAAIRDGDVGDITSGMRDLGNMISRQVTPGFADMRVGLESIIDPGVQIAGSIAPELAAQLEAAGEAAATAGDSVSASAIDYLAMQAGMSDAADAAKDLDDQIGALTDTVNAAISSDLAYQGSLNSTEDALLEVYGKTVELNAAQGTDRVAALEAMERAELAATEAVVAQSAAAVKLWEDQMLATGGTLSQADAARIQRDELIKVRDTLDPSSALYANLSGYIDRLGNIPGVVETTINISNSDALRRIAEVGGALKEAGILADQYGMGMSSRSTVPGRRTGGPMKAGQPYITHADELVVPEEDKHVFTAAQTANLMGNTGSGTPVGMGGGGGGVNIYLTVQAGMIGQDVPRMAVEALQQAVQQMGASTVHKALKIPGAS